MKPRGRRVDPAKRKARRQKQIAIAGAVILLALAGFQLPKILNHGKSSSAAPAASTSATAPQSGEPAAVTTPASGTPGAVATVPTSTVLPDVSEPTASSGQLVSFSLFRSKDPFRPQLVPTAETTTAPTETPPTSTKFSPPAATPPATEPTPAPAETTTEPPAETTTEPPAETTTEPPAETTPTPTPGPTETAPTSTGGTTTTETAETTPAPKPTAAKISVNGVAELVSVGGDFPKAEPLFRLASIKDGVARIGIAGGTLQGSSQTVPLITGKPVTLMNTADGMRYVLRLVSFS